MCVSGISAAGASALQLVVGKPITVTERFTVSRPSMDVAYTVTRVDGAKVGFSLKPGNLAPSAEIPDCK